MANTCGRGGQQSVMLFDRKYLVIEKVNFNETLDI